MTSRLPTVERADVYVKSTLAGTLERTAGGSRFRYAPSYVASPLPAVAVTLPKRVEAYDVPGENLHPFFANLLPEGTRLEALMGAMKGAKDDLLSMLVVVGADTIGDVSVVAAGRPLEDTVPTVDLDGVRAMSFREMLRESLAYGSKKRYERTALPGVQDKVSARHLAMSIRARRHGAYILKLSSSACPKIVENEHFFMSAAKSAGIAAAECRLLEDGEGERALLVARFDRVGDPVQRIHQEDACQLMGRYPADKYAVSLRAIADAIIAACDAPFVQIGGLLRLHAFSYLIGNGDLHAKNIAVYAPSGELRLTPAYDLVSTLPYGDTRMALKLEGTDNNLRRTGFLTFGARIGLRAPVIHAILDEVCEAAPNWLGSLEQIGLGEKQTRLLRVALRKRRDGLR